MKTGGVWLHLQNQSSYGGSVKHCSRYINIQENLFEHSNFHCVTALVRTVIKQKLCFIK